MEITVADCIYKNILYVLRRDRQGTGLLVISRNKDNSLKGSAGIRGGAAD